MQHAARERGPAGAAEARRGGVSGSRGQRGEHSNMHVTAAAFPERVERVKRPVGVVCCGRKVGKQTRRQGGCCGGASRWRTWGRSRQTVRPNVENVARRFEVKVMTAATLAARRVCVRRRS